MCFFGSFFIFLKRKAVFLPQHFEKIAFKNRSQARKHGLGFYLHILFKRHIEIEVARKVFGFKAVTEFLAVEGLKLTVDYGGLAAVFPKGNVGSCHGSFRAVGFGE